MTTLNDVHPFWFGSSQNLTENAAAWWKKDPAFDATIKNQFLDLVESGIRGELDNQLKDEKSYLSYIILLDQFPRNIFRNNSKSFAADPKALDASLNGQNQGLDQALETPEQAFFYMPMMHSEDINIQKKAVETFQKMAESAPSHYQKLAASNVDFAIQHFDIIHRFGRFPHRNAILNRPSTPEEDTFLTQPGSHF